MQYGKYCSDFVRRLVAFQIQLISAELTAPLARFKIGENIARVGSRAILIRHAEHCPTRLHIIILIFSGLSIGSAVFTVGRERLLKRK